MTALPEAITGLRGNATLRLVAAGALAAMLAGCNQAHVAESRIPDDYRARHPISLTEGERTVELFIGRNRGGLTPVQRADVLAFAQTWRREAMGGIIIDVPWGGPTDRAAADSMREVHSILSASGVPRNAVQVRRHRPGAALASIKINYTRLTAQAGPCGQWPDDLGPAAGRKYIENRQYWNLGCATQRNMAAMVANPADLVQPRGEGPVYSAQRAGMLDRHRKGEATGATYKGYEQGAISDVGK